MTLKQSLDEVTELFRKNQIAIALIGGFALAAHGVSRATVDIDLLADGNKKDLIVNCCKKSGFQIVFQSEEVLQLAGSCQLDIVFANRTHSQKMLKNAKIIANFPLPIVTVEDLIGLKIQAYKNDISREHQDKADIQALLKANPHLDLNIVKEYADLFNEWPALQELKSRI